MPLTAKGKFVARAVHLCCCRHDCHNREVRLLQAQRDRERLSQMVSYPKAMPASVKKTQTQHCNRTQLWVDWPQVHAEQEGGDTQSTAAAARVKGYVLL
mmetsp:Transcript_138203/g.251639  ORF Transcript_138203/g.251639 Transcript_138203/m.251639 type:complete len:99 (-) Transcript_138203:175-471(-)